MAEVTLTISAEDGASNVLAKVSQGLDKLSKGSINSGAASRKAGQDATEGSKGFTQFAEKLNVATASIKDLLTPTNLLTSVIGIGLVSSLRHAISEAGQYSMEMQRLRLVTGASLSEIGELQDAASKLGVGTSTLQRAFFFLSSEIESGGRNLAKFGISTRDASGNQRSMMDIIGRVSDRFKEMSSSTERAVAARKLFTRSGASMLPLFELERKQIEELGESGREFNKQFGEEGVKNNILLKGAVDETREAMMRLHITLVSDLRPAIKYIADTFAHIVDIFWAIPQPIRVIGEVVIGMGIALIGGTLAVKGLVAAFHALGIATIVSDFAKLFGVGQQVAATSVLMSDGYKHLAETAAGASIAIRALHFAIAALPLAILIAIELDIGGIRTKIQESGRAFGQMIGQQIRSMAGLPPIEIDTRPRGFQSWSDFWQRTKELFGFKKDSHLDEGVRAAARQGAETGDREQTLAELQIEIGLKHQLLQAEAALIKATKDSVTAELHASKIKQQTAVDAIDLELKKLSDRSDADVQILEERKKLEQVKTYLVKTGEAERDRILGQQAAGRLQQAAAVEQQYRDIRLRELDIEQMIALNGLEMAKTANRQALDDLKITQEEMVQQEILFTQEELDVKLRYLDAVGRASEQRAKDDKRIIEAQAKAAGETAKDTALKINKVDADLAAARIDNAAKVAQANIDAENKTQAALRIEQDLQKKIAKERQIWEFVSSDIEAFGSAVAKNIRPSVEEIERLTNAQVELKRISQVDAWKAQQKAVAETIQKWKEYAQAQQLSGVELREWNLKVLDAEVKLKNLNKELSVTGQLQHVFESLADVFSLFGIKVGKVILMLQNMPRMISGFEKLATSLTSLISVLTGSATPAAASQAGGQGGGIFGMLGQLGSFLGLGGSNPAAQVLQWGAAPAGSSATLGAPMMAGQAGGMMGMMGAGSMAGPVGAILALTPLVMMAGKKIGGLIWPGNKAAAQGAKWGALLGPVGSLLGGFIGSFFGTVPKAKLKANILPFDLDELTKGGLRDLDTAVKGTRVGAIGVNVKGNVYKTSKEHRLEEEFARALNDLFIDMVKGIKKLIPELPKMVGAELDAALESLSETGLQFEKFSKSGSKAKKKLKKHLQNLPNEMIEAVVEELGFGKLDLKLMGGGDAAKGFEGLLGALGGLSAVLKRVTGSADNFTGTLEEFTDQSIEFFEQFRRGGETFSETVSRVNQGFASLFDIMDQLTMDASMSAQSGMQGMVEAYQRSVEQITDASDALTVAIESGASPDEVAAAAQAVRDAMNVSMDVLAAIQRRLDAINAAIVTGVDLYVDLESRIRALGGSVTTLEELFHGAEILMAAVENLGAKISVFESLLTAVGSSFDTWTTALPRVSQIFETLLSQIRDTEDNAQAVTQLQALAQAVVNGAQAAYQGIANEANAARDAAQAASDAQIEALGNEREAIQSTSDERLRVLREEREAIQASANAQKSLLQNQLDLTRQWKSLLGSVRAQLTDLFMLLAPTHPETSFNAVLAQFRAAVSGFGPGSSPEAAERIQELARQVLQLAQGVPGMDLPSQAFQSLAAEVQAALEAIQAVADGQPTEEDLLGQIAEIDREQTDLLAAIDAAIETEQASLESRLAALDGSIRAEQARLQQTLQSISDREQSQRAAVSAQQAAMLDSIREHLGQRLEALRIEQEAAREVLKQITGELTWEQFIAQKQDETVDMLNQIRDILQSYLAGLLQALSAPTPQGPSDGSSGGGSTSGSSTQTVSQILKSAGYSKSQRERMSLVTAQSVLGFPGDWWTDLLFPLGFSMETTLKQFFKKTFNTNQYDFTLDQVMARLQEMLGAIPAMASGGIVTRPTLAWVGDDGPEAVIPLKASGRNLLGGGSTITLTINVNATGDVNAKRLADQLEKELAERLRYGRLNASILSLKR